MAVSFEVAHFGEVLLRDCCHALVHFCLDFRIQFIIVDADEVILVRRDFGTRIKSFGHQAFHLLDAALVISHFLHDLEEHGNVHRDDGNDGARARDKSFVHRDIGFAVEVVLQFLVEFQCGCFEMLLGATDCTVAVDGVRKFRADI